MGSEFRYTDIGMLKKRRCTSFRDAQHFVADGIDIGETEVIYFFDLSSKIFDDRTK